MAVLIFLLTRMFMGSCYVKSRASLDFEYLPFGLLLEEACSDFSGVCPVDIVIFIHEMQ